MVATMTKTTIATISMEFHPHVAPSRRVGVVSVDLVGGITSHTCNERCVCTRTVADLDIIKAGFVYIGVAVAPTRTILMRSKTIVEAMADSTQGMPI